MIKLFNIELKNGNPLALASEVILIMHDIKSIAIELDIPLIPYVKEYIPPIHSILSHCKKVATLRRLPLNPLRRSLLKERRIFKIIKLLSLPKKLCVLHKKRIIMHNILLEEEVAEEEEEGRILELGGGHTFPRIDV